MQVNHALDDAVVAHDDERCDAALLHQVHGLDREQWTRSP